MLPYLCLAATSRSSDQYYHHVNTSRAPLKSSFHVFAVALLSELTLRSKLTCYLYPYTPPTRDVNEQLAEAHMINSLPA